MLFGYKEYEKGKRKGEKCKREGRMIKDRGKSEIKRLKYYKIGWEGRGMVFGPIYRPLAGSAGGTCLRWDLIEQRQ
jgi:hypothetical protein